MLLSYASAGAFAMNECDCEQEPRSGGLWRRNGAQARVPVPLGALLIFAPLLMLMTLSAAAPAEAQVGQQPNRNRRPPPTAPPGAGQSADANALQALYPGVNAMLERRFIAMNLRKPDSPPFHELVRIHYELNGQAQDGTYEIFWAGTGYFREVFQLGGAQEIDVANDNKMYTTRTSVAVTLPLRNVRELVKAPMPEYLMVDYDVISVADEQVEGQTRSCIHISKRDENTNRQATAQICVEPDSKQIVSISAQGDFLNAPTNIQLTSFKSLGVKRYPMHMTTTVATENMPSANIEANVETLENVTKFDDEPFAPPQGAAVRDWCSTLAAAPSLEDYDQPSFPQDQLKNLAEFFVLVGADGRVVEAEPVRAAADPDGEQKIATWIKTARFPIQNCGVTPVEYETFYTPKLKRVY
jgi:hypothetical protein